MQESIVYFRTFDERKGVSFVATSQISSLAKFKEMESNQLVTTDYIGKDFRLELSNDKGFENWYKFYTDKREVSEYELRVLAEYIKGICKEELIVYLATKSKGECKSKHKVLV